MTPEEIILLALAAYMLGLLMGFWLAEARRLARLPPLRQETKPEPWTAPVNLPFLKYLTRPGRLPSPTCQHGHGWDDCPECRH